MTIRSIIDLLAEADANLPDNATQLISAADVRNLIKDFLDTMSPAYGAIQMASQALTLSVTPLVLAPFSALVAAAAGYYLGNLTNGTVTRQIASVVPGATDFVIASGGVSGPNNNNVTVTLYKNGAPTPFTASVTCSGAGDVVGFNLAGISYTDTVDAVYDLRATGPAGSYTFTNVLLLVQAQPVRSFV